MTPEGRKRKPFIVKQFPAVWADSQRKIEDPDGIFKFTQPCKGLTFRKQQFPVPGIVLPSFLIGFNRMFVVLQEFICDPPLVPGCGMVRKPGKNIVE